MLEYKLKQQVIEAIEWTGGNIMDVAKFAGANVKFTSGLDNDVIVSSVMGPMLASVGDYIIKGVNGEFFPVAKEIFEKNYERHLVWE